MNFSFSIDNKCQMRMVQFSGEVQLRTRKKRQKWFKSWDHGSGPEDDYQGKSCCSFWHCHTLSAVER